MTKSVSVSTAEKVALAIRERWQGHAADQPSIRPGGWEGLGKNAKVILWEGSPRAPYDWPHVFSDTRDARALALELGVTLEPLNGVTLGLYPRA